MQDPTLRDRILRYRADPGLSRDQAAARISAYVYGNIIVFATMVPLGVADLSHGHGALPVLTSGLIPAILLLAGGRHWLPERASILASEAYLLFRMALIGLLVERLRSERASARTLASGLVLAVAAAAVALVKVALGH
ncbi:hypothetical protein [Actinoplanes sp. NPDC023714]|uniref:hypothetical protein n=1 Tax=Actinoplanes sp. NPDC023714 TaxID=3154322 RepID=UPI0033EAE987